MISCKHFLSLFEHKVRIFWNSFEDVYRKSPFFDIGHEDFELDADTSAVYPAADNYDVSADITLSEEKPRQNNISIENHIELPLSK